MLKLLKPETRGIIRENTEEEVEEDTRSFYTPTKSVRINSTQNDPIACRNKYKPESLSFKLILKVIVKDSDTNFVHTFSLSSHAFLMQKSTASCFKSSINT